jgi:hypothetical protein
MNGLSGLTLHREIKNTYRFLLKNLKERHYLKYLGLDERIILRQIYNKQGVKKWTESEWIRKGV